MKRSEELIEQQALDATVVQDVLLFYSGGIFWVSTADVHNLMENRLILCALFNNSEMKIGHYLVDIKIKEHENLFQFEVYPNTIRYHPIQIQ